MLLKQESNGSRDMLSKQSSASDSMSRQDSQISYIEPRKGILCVVPCAGSGVRYVQVHPVDELSVEELRKIK